MALDHDSSFGFTNPWGPKQEPSFYSQLRSRTTSVFDDGMPFATHIHGLTTEEITTAIDQ
jgi:hypothetical protein